MMQNVMDAVEALSSSAVDLLQNLVRIPSVTGNETEVQRFIADFLKQELGLDVDEWCPTRSDLEKHPAFCDDGTTLGTRPVVVGTWHGTEKQGAGLILNGHADVVPAGDEASWKYGPWNGALHNGAVWGRGSCDMKGGLVAGMLAIQSLQKAGFQPRRDVLFESVIGEETGGVGTLATLIRGFSADAAIVLEPTKLEICPVGAGAASFRLHVPGLPAHGAMRQEGVSAIDNFYHLNRALSELERSRHQSFQHSLFDVNRLIAPLSVGKLTAGDWPSTVPASLVAEGRYGIFPGETLEAARSEFEKAVSNAADSDPWLRENRPAIEWFEGQFEPAETPLDSSIISAIRDAHHTVAGKLPAIRGVPYGSDLRFFTNYAKIPAVLYGPGDVAFAHSIDEQIEITEIIQAAKVLAVLIARS
jgi:acetylornithine deacetylase